MNKDKKKMTIEEIAMILAQADRECLTKSDDCSCCNAWGKEPCASYNEAEALYNAGYRKLADDEIVIKKSEYDAEQEKTFLEWREEYDQNCLLRLRVSELEKELEKAKQETAREILQGVRQFCYDDSTIVLWLKNKFGIELEV